MGSDRDKRGDRGGRTPDESDKDSPEEGGWPGKKTLTGRLSARVFRRARGTPVPSIARRLLIAAAERGGVPLPDALRRRLERALGADLGPVRVHTDEHAADAADAVGATAYAVGQDIYFARGFYDPDSAEGQHLLAHEVAHTVQQGEASLPSDDISVSSPGDTAEVEADRAADAFVAGPDAAVASGPAAAVQPAVAEPGELARQRAPAAAPSTPVDVTQFLSQTFEKLDFRPADATTGLFDASYHPAAGILTIVSRVAFEFVDGDPAEKRWAKFAKRAGKQFPSTGYQWQQDEKASWAAATIGQVEQQWQGRFAIVAASPAWQELPQVQVRIDIQETCRDDAHYVVSVTKWPQDAGPGTLRAQMDKLAGDNRQGTGSWSHFPGDRRDNIADMDGISSSVVLFERDSAEVNNKARNRLLKLGQKLGKANTDSIRLKLTGHASSDEGDDASAERLSNDRARHASELVVQGGAKEQPIVESAGKAGAQPVAGWRRVNIGSAGQYIPGHEWGHIFGLADEYYDRQRISHEETAKKLKIVDDIKGAADGRVMSTGDTFRPWHYTTFVEVLVAMTRIPDWKIEPAGPGPKR